MTIEQLNELERLEKAATNANWASPEAHKDGTCQVYATHSGPLRCCVPVANTMKHDGDFIAALRNAAPALLALARKGLAVQGIRPDEWEYMLKTFEAGNDRQWAIATAIRKALKLGEQ